MSDFERELKSGFLEEAAQLLSDTEQCFLSLESKGGEPATVDRIFRLAHNLKGSAKAVGFDEMGDLTHDLESLLLKLKSGELGICRRLVSLLLRCNDHLCSMVQCLQANPEAPIDCAALRAEIRAAMTGSAVPEEEQSGAAAPEASAEEPSFPEPDLSAPKAEPLQSEAPAQKDESIRVNLSRLDKLLNFVGEMVILQTVIKEQSLSDNPHLLRKSVHQLGKVTKEIQDISMSLRMVPVRQTFLKMQRIVRDVSASLGKKTRLTLVGEDTEIDKTVLENLGDPLVHLVRNAVDHGIEDPRTREKRGKRPSGEIVLGAYHQGGNLVIEVRDDGAGIDAEALSRKAVDKGILRPGQTLSEADAFQLIFHSGFTTKETVTDVSGRGVGMDVVKTNIERIQGQIDIESRKGEGSCFRIRLPLTLAIIDAMVVRLEEDRFVIPLSHVHESIRPGPADVQSTSTLGELLMLRGENLPLFRLESLLSKKARAKPVEECIAILTRRQGVAFAILVDDIVGQHQVVVKQLGPEHRGKRGLSGSAVLGDGRPSLILELTELLENHKKQRTGVEQSLRRMSA